MDERSPHRPGHAASGDAHRGSARSDGRSDGAEPQRDLEPALVAALRGLRSTAFVMTSTFDGTRSGMRVLSVQVCAIEPLLVCVATRKGHVVEPLIRDSRCFALCAVSEEDILTRRKFPEDDAGGEDDPFDAIAVNALVTGAPVIRKSPLVFDCEVVRHFDLEADHELYVGLVVGGRAEA